MTHRHSSHFALKTACPPRLHHLIALIVIMLAACAPVWALDYTVELEAPPELKPLLEKNLDLLRWRGNAQIDEAQLARLVAACPEQIKSLIATEGFYSPQILPTMQQSGTSWRIRLQVDPGEVARVSELELDLQGFLPGVNPSPDALRSNWPLAVGSVFRQAQWEQAKRSLLRQVQVMRYPRAQLMETRADVDLETQQVKLTVVLQSGPAVSFGDLQIEGLQRYPQSVVNHVNTIRPGDVYDEQALLELQTRLQDSHYFSAVAVSADPGVDENVAPVLVRLVEQRRKKVDVGLGYSTNTGNRVQLAYADLSWLGTQLSSALTLETRKQTARADWLLPPAWLGRQSDKNESDTISSGVERQDLNGEVTRLATLAFKRSWGTPVFSRSVTLEYQNEHKIVASLPQVRSHTLPLTWQMTRRDFDQILFPTRGSALTVQFGGAPLRVLTDEPFLRGSIKYLQYWPLNAQNRMVGRAEFGALASRHKDGIPASYLFRAGGDQSVRGYGYQQLGEKVLDAVVGARYLASASLEYQYWPQPVWGTAVFFDSGNAQDKLSQFRFKSGYGMGVRYKSPVGPINLDLAYGHAVRQYRIHFSLGVAF